MKDWGKDIDRIFRAVICVLLFAILMVQILILQRMPPNISEIRSAQGEDRKKIVESMPMVRVFGKVTVDD